MTSGPAHRTWAPIRFPSLDTPQISDEIREQTRLVYALQAEDDRRFASAASDLLRRIDLDRGVVIAMTCDHRFAELFANWAASCNRAEIDHRARTIVFPTDRTALERVEALGFVAYYDDESRLLGEMTESAQYGDRSWTKYMYHQNWVIRALLGLGVDVLFQDVDLVWLRDPVPVLQEHARQGAAIQAMYDGPNSRYQPLYANSGFLYFGESQRVRDFWDEVYARHDMIAYYRSQQVPLNVLLAAHAHRGLDVRILDEARFANGHLYCGPRTPPPEPWVVHMSWTADLSEKLERYGAYDLWFL